jgi:D-alanyl-lipoteichoic acid acyltransferase DltB (MBOAT superfamily)
MFSANLYWVTCILIGLIGAGSNSRASNNLFQSMLLLVSLALITITLEISVVPLCILLCIGLLAAILVKLKLSVGWIIGPLVLLWSGGKIFGFVLVPELPFVAFVGISYFVVKLFTFLRDYQVGLVKDAKIITTMNYLFFAPTFVSGPMHYYSEFDKTVRAPNLPAVHSIIPLLYRICLGSLKVLVVSPFLAPYGFPVIADGPLTLFDLLVRSFVFTFQLYFQFSGYCDMAIGSSSLMGLKTPENFKNPLMSRNIVEFWQRWHITLMRVITGYIYVPLVRNLSAKKDINSRMVMMIGLLIAFLISGFWHGATTNFIIWGLYHAFFMISYELSKPVFGRLYKNKLFSGKLVSYLIRFSSIFVTFVIISVGWILFNLTPSMLFSLLGLS